MVSVGASCLGCYLLDLLDTVRRACCCRSGADKACEAVPVAESAEVPAKRSKPDASDAVDDDASGADPDGVLARGDRKPDGGAFLVPTGVFAP